MFINPWGASRIQANYLIQTTCVSHDASRCIRCKWSYQYKYLLKNRIRLDGFEKTKQGGDSATPAIVVMATTKEYFVRRDVCCAKSRKQRWKERRELVRFKLYRQKLLALYMRAVVRNTRKGNTKALSLTQLPPLRKSGMGHCKFKSVSIRYSA